MAGEACTLVQHGRRCMSSCLEQGQGLMAARKLIVATAAVFNVVAHGAGGAVQCGVLAMRIVFPARRMRNRAHHLMALDTLQFCLRRRLHVQVANETLGIRSRSLLDMLHSE